MWYGEKLQKAFFTEWMDLDWILLCSSQIPKSYILVDYLHFTLACSKFEDLSSLKDQKIQTLCSGCWRSL